MGEKQMNKMENVRIILALRNRSPIGNLFSTTLVLHTAKKAIRGPHFLKEQVRKDSR